MTVIEKIYLRGFKSFAKPTEIPICNGFNIAIGPNGSGKTIHPNTKIKLANGSEIKIGKLVESQLGKNKVETIDDGVYCESKEPIEILSLNPISMKLEKKKISKFIKRNGDKHLYRIITKTGKEIIATQSHPLITYNNKKLNSTLIKYIKLHQKIALPRVVNYYNNKKQIIEKQVFSVRKVNPSIDILPQEANFLVKETANLLGLKIRNIRKQYPKLAAYCENRCCPTRDSIREIIDLFKEKLEILYDIEINIILHQFNLINAMDQLALSDRYTSEKLGPNLQIIRQDWAPSKFIARRGNLEHFFEFIESTIKDRLLKIKYNLMILYNLANSDIFWDEVISIKKVRGTRYIYDLTIPENHNFIGNGIFVHNSNIMDALTFVLGKSSAKSMRAERSSNLIYNGGKKGSPAREAEVSIYFSNKEKEFPLATETVKITRLVKQSGNSIYKINDKGYTRQQVVDVLSKAKIDPNGYNIVLQGDITSLVTMKPEDRRLIIEDISGISLYEDKKQKALLELNKVEEKLNESNLILKERSAYLRELKEERDQALKYKEVEEKIKENKATYINLQIKEKEGKKEEIEKKTSKQHETLNIVNNKIKELKDVIEKKKNELEYINKEIENKGEVEQVLLQKDLENLREDLIKKSTRAENVKSEIEKITQRIQQLNKDKEEIQKKIQYLNEQKSKLEDQDSELKLQESKIKKQITNFKQDHNLTDFSSIEKLESEIENTQNKSFKLKEEQNHILNLIEKNSTDLERIHITIEEQLSHENKEKLQNLKKIEKEIDYLVNKYNVTISQIELTHDSLNIKKLELGELQATKVRINESLEGNLAVNTILNSKFPGVYGTIATLGRVDQKYAKAMEVVASSRINSIIVDTDLTAQRCINLLKEKKAGTAVFLPLNKLKETNVPKELQQLKNFSGVKDLAINLISYDKKYNKAFSYIFGSTLVVDDIITARKIGIGRARMVTLDGDLMEHSGAMIGGYRKKTLGLFEHKNVDNKTNEIENEIENLKSKLLTLQKERTAKNNEIERLKNDKSILQAELAKLQIENIDELKEERIRLTKEIKEYQNQLNKTEKQINETQKELEKLKVSRKPTKTEENLQNVLDELEKKQLEIHGKIIQNTTEMKNIQDQISTIHKPEFEKIHEIIKLHDKEVEQFKKELKNLGEEVSDKKNLLIDKEKKEKLFRENYKSLFIKRNEIQDHISKLESRIGQEDFKAKEIEKRVNDIYLERAKVVAELEAQQAEFEPYIGTKLRKNILKEDLKAEIIEAEKLIKNFGNINMKALEVYETAEKEYQELIKKLEALNIEKGSVLNMMAEIEDKKKKSFMKTYKQIAENFKRMFLQLSAKGDAYLDLEDKENPLNGGLNINVRIGGTKFLDLHSLSGGEKALTALAFIFAIQEYEPSSFYLLDEVDAALDKTNSQLLSQLISNHAKSSQYIVISHNDHIITEADQIYGVSMQQNGISKIVSLKL